MTIADLANEDKAAILLFTLTPETTEYVLATLGPQRGARIRRLMDLYSTAPDLEELLAEVTQEFDDVLQRSIEKANEPPPPEPTPEEQPLGEDGLPIPADAPPPAEAAQAVAPAAPVAAPPAPAPSKFDPAEMSKLMGANMASDHSRDSQNPEEQEEGDPLQEVRELDVDRLTNALQQEHPKAVAIVLLCLPEEKTVEVLRRLPAETRRSAFGLMANGLPKNMGLVESVLRAIARAARGQAQAATGKVESSDEAKFKVMADVLNMLDRGERLEMLAALQAQDAETASMIEDLLYSFEDILVIEDRSLQTILSEVGPKDLAVALMKAPEQILERVKSNMSERVRAMLEEEMQFLGAVPSEQIQKARRKVTDSIRNHDKDGSLVWKD